MRTDAFEPAKGITMRNFLAATALTSLGLMASPVFAAEAAAEEAREREERSGSDREDRSDDGEGDVFRRDLDDPNHRFIDHDNPFLDYNPRTAQRLFEEEMTQKSNQQLFFQALADHR